MSRPAAIDHSFSGASSRLRAWYHAHFTVAVAIASFAVYAATGAYRVQSWDVVAAAEPAWALAVFGSLDLSGIASDLPWYFEHGAGLYSDRFPGAILYLVPGYWIAARLGMDEFSYAPGVVTAAVVAAGSVAVMHRVFVRILPVDSARWATVFFAFGTGTWTISGHAPWSHTVGQFTVALTVLALSRKQDHVAAATSGLLALIRPVQFMATIVLGATLAWSRRSWRTAAWFALFAAPSVAALVLYNGLMFDQWGPSNGHELGGSIALRPADLPVNLLGTVFSPTRGLVFFYPFLILVPLGFRVAWRLSADWERAALLAGVAGLLTQLALNRYSGGDTFFGNRLIIEPMTFAAPLLARSAAVVATGPYRRFLLASLVIGIAIHGLGATMYPY